MFLAPAFTRSLYHGTSSFPLSLPFLLICTHNTRSPRNFAAVDAGNVQNEGDNDRRGGGRVHPTLNGFQIRRVGRAPRVQVVVFIQNTGTLIASQENLTSGAWIQR
ncbi:hypothetical protein B0H16DRAFT_1574209, partial [Mycena metata]